MMIIPHNCEFCGYNFYSKTGTITIEEERKDKYDHLRTHPEFFQKINKILDKYSNIKKWIPIKSFEYPKNGIHNFIAVVYDSETDSQFQHLLTKINEILSKYALLWEEQENNIIKRKTLNNVFSFIAELEVFDAINKTFSMKPKIIKSNNEINNDFILENMYFEVKCPLETKKPLRDYITDWNQQKQLANASNDKTPILIINTAYSYPGFPIIDGGLIRIIKENNKNIFWKCCITYNTYNKRKDILFVSTLSDKDSQNLNILSQKLIE